jgi:hypothetical protein
METSILSSVKKLLGLAEDYTAFDMDIVVFINSAFTSLSELGIAPANGFAIEDTKAKWEDLDLSQNELGLVKTYVYLKCRLLFDPPATSFVIDAITKQITEHEWRLTNHRDTHKDTSYQPLVVVTEEEVVW